jgi:hypothetical protein
VKLNFKHTILFFFLVLISLSCRRKNYVCDCEANNKSFQNAFFNATHREALDLCEAAEIKFEPGNPGLECVLFEVGD